MMNHIDNIIAYEQGELTTRETVELFSELVKSGEAWRLQGHYGRTAKAFIDANILHPSGEINQTQLNELDI